MKIKLFLAVFAFSFLTVSAYDFVENGIAYNILKNNTLEVTSLNGNDGTDKKKDVQYKGNLIIPSTVSHDGKTYKVTEIGKYAFYDDTELTSVKIPEGIKTIHSYAFCYNDIKSLQIPASVTSLIPGFVYNSPNLTQITVSPQNKNYVSEGNCIYDKKKSILILVAPGSLSYTFPSTVKKVVDYAIDCPRMNKLVVPKTVVSIGGKAIKISSPANIVCRHKLKHIPGSEDFAKGNELPFWALGLKITSK